MPTLSIHPLDDLTRIIRPPTRLAALDIGTKTIGIALSTPDWQIATPYTTIARSKWTHDLEALSKALTGYGVGGIVVGLPLNMDGSEGPQAQSVKQTVYNLIKADPQWLAGGAICFWDERLSTSAAQDVLSENMSRFKAKAAGALDAMAAKIILESALQKLRNNLKKEE